MVGSAGRGRLLPCDCPTWKRKQEDNRKFLSLRSAGGSPGRDLKALGADLNWVLYWDRERNGMEKCREAGTARSGGNCGLSECVKALNHPRVKMLGHVVCNGQEWGALTSLGG